MLFKKLAAVLLAGGIFLGGIGQAFAYTQEDINSMVDLAKTKEGCCYVWGNTGQNDTWDCSGFTQWLYKSIGIQIPRCSYEQDDCGLEVSVTDIKKGDLITFITSNRNNGDVTHVGMYIGNGQFIHARSSKYGICINDYNDYWKSKTHSIRRILVESEVAK